MLFDGILISMLLTNNHLICCMKQFKTVCNPHGSWQTSCSPLLLNRGAQSLVMLMFLLIIFCNICSLGSHFQEVYKNYFLVNRQEKVKLSIPYQITVCFIDTGNLMYGIYLMLLWFADVYYGKDFFIKKGNWKQNFVCFLTFTASLSFYVILPIFLFFLSLLRYMVIKHPLNYKFKSPKFVMRSLFLTTFIVYVVLLTEAITFLSHHGSPNSLCSPFMDQSNSLLLVKVHALSVAFIQLLQIFSCIIM